MRAIPISQFRATCFAVLEQVRKTGVPVLVTRFGRPVAEINAGRHARRQRRRLGDLAGTGTITGDIIAPAFDAGDWNSEIR